MRAGSLVAIAALGTVGATGCMPPADRPQVQVICHNANCARATDPFADDTLATLDESLALEYRGRPAIDGIELDTLWDRESGTCQFAHDLANAKGERGMDAANRVAAHLRRSGPASWAGDTFFVKIEMKSEVTLAGDPQTPDDLAAHLECSFDMADAIIAAAIESNRQLELGFDSELVATLRQVVRHPRWPGKTPYPGIHLQLLSNVHAVGLEPTDLVSLTSAGDTHDGIDTLAFHATRVPTTLVDDYAELGVELMLWMLDVAPETLHAIRRYEPRYVNTSEALLLRRWGEQ